MSLLIVFVVIEALTALGEYLSCLEFGWNGVGEGGYDASRKDLGEYS